MGNTIERKYRLIQMISAIQDDDLLDRLEDYLSVMTTQDRVLARIAKPIQAKIDLEKIKHAQNWKPVDRKKFDTLIQDLDIQEPIDLLLSQLSR
jgi:hypothetical protein